jgi:aspartate racemase
MKTIGLIGGMSWESTAEYYRMLNQGVRERLGRQHSAKLLLTSVDFEEIEPYMATGDWDSVAAKMIACAKQLEAGGAEVVLLGTNSVHFIAPRLESALKVPFIHIVDPVGQELKRRGFLKAGLLGTRFTMEKSFFKDRLRERFGIETITPNEEDRMMLHRTIFEELVKGKLLEKTRMQYEGVIQRLENEGAQAVILGCTEIAMLTPPKNSGFPLLDTAELHVQAALNLALKDS